MLNRQRREKPQVKKAIAAGRRHVRERFGVDSDTCTGDHSCIRISGCPSLEHQAQPRPAAQRPGDHRARQLRGLRHVRRGLARRGAVPVVLPRRGDQQPERLGPPARARCGSGSSARCSAASTGGWPPPPSDGRGHAAADQDRHPRHGRRGRRRARRLDRRPGRGPRPHRADHLGGRRGAAHRRHHLLPGAVPARRGRGRRRGAGAGADPHAGRRGRAASPPS